MADEQNPQTPATATTPEPQAPETPAPASTTPQTPAEVKKFLGRFDSEEAASKHLEELERNTAQSKGFIDAVSPYFDVDEQTGSVKFKESVLSPKKEIQEPDDKVAELNSNPEAFIQTRVTKALTDAQRRIDSESEQRFEIAKKFKVSDEMFDEHLSEVDKAIKTLPMEQRGRPGLYENMYQLVRSKNIDKIIEHKVKQRLGESTKRTQMIGQVSVETSGGAGTASPSSLPELTAKEANVARHLGVSLEAYAKRKAEMLNERA